MKFTKEEAFKKLKGILTNDGKKTLRTTDRSINAMIDALLPIAANDEIELDDFVDKVKVIFETGNSNAEHDNSVFVSEWEKNHPTPQKPQQDIQKPNTPPSPTDVNTALLDKITALENKFAEQEKSKTIAELRNKLKHAANEKGIKNSVWIDTTLNLMQIDESLDVDAKASELLEIYNKQFSHVDPSVTPMTPSGTKETDPYVKFKEALKQKEEANKNVV